MTSLGGSRLDTGHRLNTEWAHLRTRPRHLARARGWRIIDTPIDDLDDVLRAVGYQTARTADAESRLRELVLIAATDELAARVVVQRLLPGLLSVVRRRVGMSDHVFEELLGAAWIAIRTFNPNRRPASIAASLISDADYNAFRADARRSSSGEVPHDYRFEEVPHVGETSACEQLAEILAAAVDAGVDAADLELIRQLLGAPTAVELAATLRITPRTIRNRRDRITSKLREVALAA